MTNDPFPKRPDGNWTLEGHRKPRDSGPKLLAVALLVVVIAAAVIFAAVTWAPGMAKLIARHQARSKRGRLPPTTPPMKPPPLTPIGPAR